jgi:signal-transduction protein with cAMP-binding, CBS, and nucleotidyltransferase domain
MTKNFAVFASIKDSEQLNTILSKLEPIVFEEGDFIMKFGQRADFLCVIFEGSVSVQIKGH